MNCFLHLFSISFPPSDVYGLREMHVHGYNQILRTDPALIWGPLKAELELSDPRRRESRGRRRNHVALRSCRRQRRDLFNQELWKPTECLPELSPRRREVGASVRRFLSSIAEGGRGWGWGDLYSPTLPSCANGFRRPRGNDPTQKSIRLRWHTH